MGLTALLASVYDALLARKHFKIPLNDFSFLFLCPITQLSVNIYYRIGLIGEYTFRKERVLKRNHVYFQVLLSNTI
jgi:hypothetical protein